MARSIRPLGRSWLGRTTPSFPLLLRSLLAGSAVVGSLLGGGSSARAQEPQPEALPERLADSLVVVSFNIRYDNPADGPDAWPLRRDWVGELLRERRPDLIGLQEVMPRQRDELIERLPDYDVYSVGRDDGAEKGEAVTIFWLKDRFEKLDAETFWLSETPETVGSRGWDAALPRIVGHVTLQDRRTERTIHLFNTHFDHQGVEARRQSAALLRQQVQHKVGANDWIVIGDLNARPESEVLQVLRGIEPAAGTDQVWSDAYESAEQRLGPDSTWNGFREIVPGNRIDHLLVPGSAVVRGLEVIDVRRDGRFPSDHLPVLGEIRFPSR